MADPLAQVVHGEERARNSMNVTLLKALVALVAACILLSGSVVLFFRGRTLSSYICSAQEVWWWSSLFMSAKHFTCFLGCIGASSIA